MHVESHNHRSFKPIRNGISLVLPLIMGMHQRFVKLFQKLFHTSFKTSKHLTSNKEELSAQNELEVSLKSNELLKGLTDEEFSQLDTLLVRKEFATGELITKQGDDGDFLYLIESGSVEVLHNDFVINHLGPGKSFGLMSFLDESKRSASVISARKTITAVLSFEMLTFLSTDPEHQQIFKKILRNHIYQQQMLLKGMNSQVINEMKEKEKESQFRINFGRLFLTVVLCLVGYVYVFDFTSRRYGSSGTLLNSSIILILGLIGYIYIRRSSFSREIFGLTLKNWKPAVREAILGSVGLILFSLAMKWLYITFVPGHEHDAYLTLNVFHKVGWAKALLMILAYAAFIPAQEIITRCAVQGSLQHFFQGKFATMKAILVTSFVFSVLHLIADPLFAYWTLVPSIFWGVLFARNPSLLGVSVSHFILGVYFIWFDFLPIEDLVHM